MKDKNKEKQRESMKTNHFRLFESGRATKNLEFVCVKFFTTNKKSAVRNFLFLIFFFVVFLKSVSAFL
jgi:hypothetical protein